MDTREVYRGAKSDYYTHCHDLPPQIGGCRVEAAGVPIKDEIDGKDGEADRQTDRQTRGGVTLLRCFRYLVEVHHMTSKIESGYCSREILTYVRTLGCVLFVVV